MGKYNEITLFVCSQSEELLTHAVNQAAIELEGNINVEQALAVGSVNLEKLLGVRDFNCDLVATQGGSLFDAGSKVVAIISERKEGIDLL